MSEQLKKVATDIKSFSDFIINDCYYVDKTKYIKTIMEDGSASILFTRPRRFGKSITISMLQSFLEMNYENPSDKSKQIALFKDTEIFKDKEFCDKYMGQYPVIFLSLKEAWDTNSYEDALQSLYEELSNSVEKFNFLLDCDKLSAEKIQKLKNILTISDNALSPVKKKAVAERMIRELTQDLLVYTGKECIVLIDEYDVPLSKAANTDFYQKIRDFISKLFSSALKNNESLKKGIITGCLRVAKESIFTGLNNFYSCGLDNYDYSKLFGFTTDEVKTMLSYYGLDDRYAEYKEWYDGYHIGDDDIFCPWDVISRTKAILVSPKLEPKSYWGGTGNIKDLQNMFANNPKAYAQNFETLLNGGSIIITVNNDINYEILGKSKNINHFWSLMFSSGYLTYKNVIQSDDGTSKAELVIPNKSVRTELKNVIDWYFSTENTKYVESLQDLLFNLKQTDPSYLEDYLQQALVANVSIYDTQKGTDKESMYHAFLNGRLSGILDPYENEYSSNAELGDGRADFSFILKLDDNRPSSKVGFIIEIKAAQSMEQMGPLSKEAIEQVKKKNYVQAMFRIYGTIKEIRVFGIAFYKKTCRVEFEKIVRT